MEELTITPEQPFDTSEPNVVREQVEAREVTDHGRSLLAGLGMAWALGPVGLLAGAVAHTVQKKQREDFLLLEESRLRGAENLISGTSEELDYIEQMSRVQETKGMGSTDDTGFLFGDLQRIGLYRKRLAHARAEIMSGDPLRVQAGQAELNDVRAGIAGMLDDDDRLAEKFEERRFNIREDQRQFTRSKVQERLTVYENAQAEFNAALAVAEQAFAQDPESAIGKAALWDFLAAPVQDANVPGVAGVATAAGGIIGTAGGPVGAGVGSTIGAGVGTLLSGGFTDEANPNEYSMAQLKQLAQAKMDALKTYTFGDGENPGIVDTYYNQAQERHGFTRDEVNYPEDRTYAQFRSVAGPINEPLRRVGNKADSILDLATNRPQEAIAIRNEHVEFLNQYQNAEKFTDLPPIEDLDYMIDLSSSYDVNPIRGAGRDAGLELINELRARAATEGTPFRLAPRGNGINGRWTPEIYVDGVWQEAEGISFLQRANVNIAVESYVSQRKRELKAINQALTGESPDEVDDRWWDVTRLFDGEKK